MQLSEIKELSDNDLTHLRDCMRDAIQNLAGKMSERERIHKEWDLNYVEQVLILRNSNDSTKAK